MLRPAQIAFLPSSSRSPSVDCTATITAGSVRGKCSRPHPPSETGQRRAQPAARTTVRVPQVEQNGASSSQRPSETASTRRPASTASSSPPAARSARHCGESGAVALSEASLTTGSGASAAVAASSTAAPDASRPRNAHSAAPAIAVGAPR